MKARKGQKFHVPELKPKVRTLEAMFGEKFMRSQLNPRTVDKWLKEPDPTPYITSLKKYFGVIGMQESDMLKPKDAFSEKAAMIYTQRIGSADVPIFAEYTGQAVARTFKLYFAISCVVQIYCLL